MARAFWLVLSVVLFGATCCSEAYKILLIPVGNKSHLIEFDGLGRVLMKRGHEVHIYLSRVDTPPSDIASAGYKFIHPETNESLVPQVLDEEAMIKAIEQPLLQQVIQNWDKAVWFKNKIRQMGEIMLDETMSLRLLREEKYDFAVVDNMIFSYFLFLVPYKLGVPFGGLTTLHESVTNRVPVFPSAFSDIGFTISFGARPQLLGSSLWERTKNLIAFCFHEFFARGWTKELYEQEQVSYDEILRSISLHLVDQHYLLSDPVPTIPHVQQVGGLVTRPAKPITEETLRKFIESAHHPVIVCSFGSMMGTLSPQIIEKLLNVFRSLPQYRIVMRLKEPSQLNVPENVMIMKWLPQNDLLGHRNTALLITHSGNNGQSEALFHGVPMVAFYVFADQEYNADRVARRGFGVKLNLMKFVEQELVDAIVEVMSNSSYRDKIKKASEIFLEENAGEKAAKLIEHVIEFGSDHLRPTEAFEMSLVEFTMLDIVFLLFILASLFIALLIAGFIKIIKYFLFRKN